MLFSRSPSAVAAAIGFAALANGHMLLAQPKPFTSPQLQNGPLVPGEFPFPCQAKPGVTYQGTATSMALGSTQPLRFTGGATHGGGSCQIAITYDTSPSASSVWKVIHSIEGGCVGDVNGNVGNDASAALAGSLTFPIPGDIPTGKATLAWAWLNRIGNREFYMNCAPIELTGSAGSEANFNSLPDMLVTNYDKGSTCHNKEGFDYGYPNPGKSVARLGTKAEGIQQLVCDAGTPGGTPGSGSGSGGGSPTKPATSAPPTKTATSVKTSSAPTKIPGGVFAPVPSSSSPPVVSAPVSKPTATTTGGASQPSATSPPSGGSGSGSDSGSAGAQTAGSSCSPEGLWNCVGGNSYQLCGSGRWSVVMGLAAGTSCTVGQSSTLNIAAVGRRVAAFRA